MTTASKRYTPSAKSLRYTKYQGQPFTRRLEKTDKYLTESEFSALLAQASAIALKKPARLWAYDAFWIMGNLGLRIGELSLLSDSDIRAQIHNQAMRVPTLKKHLGPVLVPIWLSDEEAEYIRGVLRRYGDEKQPEKRLFPHSVRTIQCHFEFCRRLAGLRTVIRPHFLRHFAAKSLRIMCKDRIEVVIERLRHEPPITSLIYLELEREEHIAYLNRRKCVY